MNEKLVTLGLAGTLFLGATLSASAQQSAAPAAPQSVLVSSHKNASEWFRAESQSVVVYSDTSHDDVRQLLNNLEKLDQLLRVYTKNYNISSGTEQKLTLYYHQRMDGFNQVATGAPSEAVGLYNSCSAGVQAFGVHLERIAELNDAELAQGPLNASLSYLFEAYARHFLYRYTDIRAPASYIDGFAQYFSTTRFSDKQMALGRVPASVARYLHFIDKGHSFSTSYDDVLEPKSAIKRAHVAESNLRLEYLTRSWLLTHHMFSSPDKLALVDQYLNLVHMDVPARKAAGDAFGLTPSTIDNTLWRYRLKGIEVKQVDMPTLPAASINFTSLPNTLTELVLAEAALKACPERAAGQALLKTVTQQAAGSNNAQTRLTLSRAQIDWGNAQDALPYLTEALAKNARNADAAYLLGLANLRLAEQQNETARKPYLDAARRHLATARALNPRSAEAAYAAYKAELLVSDTPGKAALAGALIAWKRAHEVNSFARAAGLAYAYLGQAAEADNALTLLAHDTRDPAMAAWAEDWKARLAAGVSHAELVAEMRRQPVSGNAFKEWTVSTEALMEKVQYNAGMDDARGYINSMQMPDPSTGEVLPSTPGKR